MIYNHCYYIGARELDTSTFVDNEFNFSDNTIEQFLNEEMKKSFDLIKSNSTILYCREDNFYLFDVVQMFFITPDLNIFSSSVKDAIYSCDLLILNDNFLYAHFLPKLPINNKSLASKVSAYISFDNVSRDETQCLLFEKQLNRNVNLDTILKL